MALHGMWHPYCTMQSCVGELILGVVCKTGGRPMGGHRRQRQGCSADCDCGRCDLTANGEGQSEHAQDSRQDPGAEQLEGHLQPNAHPVKAQAQDGWLLVKMPLAERSAAPPAAKGRARRGRWRHLGKSSGKATRNDLRNGVCGASSSSAPGRGGDKRVGGTAVTCAAASQTFIISGSLILFRGMNGALVIGWKQWCAAVCTKCLYVSRSARGYDMLSYYDCYLKP